MERVVGRTPLVKVEGVFAKLECTNPCGSIKDRIGQYIIEQSESCGLLRPGQRIVEATSGNTGIAFAWVARQTGHPITIVMPENMTEERKQALRSLGADVILCSAKGSFTEAAQIRDRLAAENGWFNPDQFSNPLNVECHERTTGHEIVRQLAARKIGPVGAFVAGVGTGGTLVGVGKRLRTEWPSIQLVAVEPAESAVMSGGPAGAHGIAGIGDGFIPAIAAGDREGRHRSIDQVARVSTDEAREAARRLAQEHGFCVGVSAGANLVAALRLKQRHEVVVTVFADGYAKYQTQGLHHCEPGRCAFEHDSVVSPDKLSH